MNAKAALATKRSVASAAFECGRMGFDRSHEANPGERSAHESIE